MPPLPPQIESKRELFLTQLAEMLVVEETLARQVLPKLAQEAQDQELKQGFQNHVEQTRQHARNVEDAFRALGEQPRGEQAPQLEALKKEHDATVPKLATALRDPFRAASAIKTEHAEIAAYTTLVTQAEAMEEPEVARLLRENLEQERTTLADLEAAADRLARS